mmetsp:Transcript_47924/g.139683  ORF Transcript_47924/g.139683 Transcript_47924/m.139683 type:complete len:218 (-) Transcript_47924:1687-2340(-)
MTVRCWIISSKCATLPPRSEVYFTRSSAWSRPPPAHVLPQMSLGNWSGSNSKSMMSSWADCCRLSSRMNSAAYVKTWTTHCGDLATLAAKASEPKVNASANDVVRSELLRTVVAYKLASHKKCRPLRGMLSGATCAVASELNSLKQRPADSNCMCPGPGRVKAKSPQAVTYRVLPTVPFPKTTSDSAKVCGTKASQMRAHALGNFVRIMLNKGWADK